VAITTTYTYDPLNQITTVTDHKGNITTNVYDMLGRRVSINNLDRGLVEFTYDLAGNLVEKIDGTLRKAGQAIRYSYQYNRLQGIHYPSSPDVEYHYGEAKGSDNQAGRISKVIDASGTAEYCYGKLGEKEKSIRTMNFLLPGQKAWVFETETAYDYLGRMQWMSYPDGEKVHYVYDKGGAVKSVYGTKFIDRYDYVKQISYDEFGQRVYIKYGNDVETTYTYDPNRRWLTKLYTKNSAGTILQNTGYTFDKVGNVLSLNNAATSTVQTYQYDDLYQLTSAIGTSVDGTKPNTYTQTLSYDTIGNMLKKTSVSQKGLSNNTPLDLNYVLTFQYTGTLPHAASQIGDWTYTYDANGNTIQKKNVVTATIPSTQYFWDEENRLMRVQQNGVNTDFIYDAAGTRTVKCSPQGETLYVSEFYQFQNQDVVTKHIFVGNTRIVSKLSKYNNTSSLHKTDYEGSNIYTYHPDHIGSSNFITDMAGNKFEHLEYTPYGETWIDEGSKLNIIGYRFTGKELDTETGLYYYGARYLDPQSSRWMSVDPALAQYMPEMPLNDAAKQRNANLPGMGGAFNPVNMALYHYAGNNPVKYIDPTGEAYRFSSEDFKSDWAGRFIVWHYLFGSGEEVNISSDPSWAAYMKANKSLRDNVRNIVIREAWSIPDGSIKTINIETSMEIENGESMTGYNYLHGTNKDVGGFRITGTIEKGAFGATTYSLTYQWNDIMDPNLIYSSDIQKAKFAELISFGRAKDYIFRVSWTDESLYIPNSQTYEGWLFDD